MQKGANFDRARAFSLIELLVVIIIIGVLTTIASISFNKVQQNTRDNARKTAANSIATALEAYRALNQSYPGSDTPDALYPNLVGKCINDNTYYYNPNTDCSAEDKNPYRSPSTHANTAFLPSPGWIPGLGKFLVPIPTEPRYLGAVNSDPTAPAAFANTGSPAGTTRTLSYRKSSVVTIAYYVYAGLENNNPSVYQIIKRK